MFAEVSGFSQGDTAQLSSPYYYKKYQCLQFWYHMYGSSIGTLNVYTAQFFFQRLSWTKTGNQGNEWRKAQVSLPLYFFGVSITFEAVRGSSFYGDIAIDDVTLLESTCPGPGDCTFEKDRCEWLEVHGTDRFDWLLGSGSTSSFSTGPSVDHTLGTGQGKFWGKVSLVVTFRCRFFFLHIYKVHIHKSNHTRFYAIILQNVVAIYQNKAHHAEPCSCWPAQPCSCWPVQLCSCWPV